MIILKPREVFLTLFSVIFLILVLILGGCGGGGGGPSTSGGAGTISLAWDAPTTNSDGSLLTDLQGFYVYYATAAGVTFASPRKDVGMATQQGNTITYTLTGLTPGQRYFIAVSAYDTSLNESQLSNEANGVAK